MRSRWTVSLPALAAVFVAGAFISLPTAAQGQGGKKDEPVFVRPKAGSPPAPRLPDGHIDLGNGKGAWNAYTIKDLTGHGWGDQPVANAGKRGPQVVEKVVEVEMLPWAKKFVDQVDATVSKDDPEALCI